jgi:hypothetical protein
MATVAVLPSTVSDKLAATARRVRILRAVRGVSVLALTLLLLAAAAFAADAWLDLPAGIRFVSRSVWLGAGASIGVFGLLIPICRRIGQEALAAAVEQRYGDLGERLTSSVELSGESDRANGSPALISLLIQETAARTGPLHFPGAIPARRTVQLAVVACVAVLASAVAAATMPSEFARLCVRFFHPDSDREAIAAYALTVIPGDAIAARGRPFTVTARLERTTESAALPHGASLIVTDGDGQVTRLPMTVDSGEFVYRIDSLAGDFCYRVESGKAVSPDYQVTAVEPINVTADGLKLTITPPAYARHTFQPESFTGFHDIATLQHGRVRLEVRFTQPARKASLAWPAEKKPTEAGTTAHPLALASDRRSGTIEVPALSDGAYKLLLEGENGFATELAGGELSVHVDQPPVVSKFASAVAKDSPVPGQPLPAVLPYERVPIDVALADDVGIAAAELEYRVNEGVVQREEIPLHGPGTTRVQASHVFNLSGKVKEGDEVRFRLGIADNRDVPEAGLKPHVVYYPPERWLGLRIAGQALPLAQQDIQSQRDEIDKRLEKIKKDLTREQRGVYKLRQETRNQPSLLPEQSQELKSLKRENESSREALEQLARETAETPDLRDLAENVKEVADEELKRSEADLTDAAKEEQARQRQQHLNDADRQVTAALSKLEALRRVNDRLARELLDQAKLDAAARREEDLAKRAEELAAKDPVKDSSAKPQADELQREQKKIADDLDQAANQSEALKKALDAAREEQARQLGDKARDLAKEERELAKTNRDPKLDKLAKKQQEIAAKADVLAKKTRPTTQAAQTQPLKPDDAHRAADALNRGDAADALKHQEQAENEMQRLARDLDRAAEQARDPKETARQLARLQKDLQQRLADETRKNYGQPPPADATKELESEQKAIAKAAENLSVPPNDELQKERKQAAEQAGKAADALRERNTQRANEKMEQSRQALKRLAERLPNLQLRREEAAAEAERLRQKQEEVARQAAEASKQAEKREPQAEKNRAEAARKEAEIAERLGKMDAPMQEAQRDRAREAANQAQKDLADGKSKESADSQQSAKDALKRLSDALAGKQSASQSPSKSANSPQGMPSKEHAAQASDLARQQRELRDEVRRLADEASRANQTPQRKLQEQTGELAKALDRLAQQSNGSPQVQQAARKSSEAAQQAQNAMQQAQNQSRQGNQGQAQQSQQQAAQMLDRAGQELAQAAGKNPSPGHQAGKDLQQAREQMSQAQTQLNQGQAQSAQRSMQQAAKALQQAAQQMAQKPGTPKRDGQPNAFGAAPGGKPEEEGPALDPKKYASKRWGELPGSLQTKIIQDLKAKYGDDYSRIIKLYFEEIADLPAPPRPK